MYKLFKPWLHNLFWNIKSSYLFAVAANSQQTGGSVAGHDTISQVQQD